MARHFYQQPAWRKLRLIALRRDHFRCVVCGIDVSGSGKARVDHIKPRKTHPHLAFTLSNLRTLCPAHDAQSHLEKLTGSTQRIERFTLRGCDANGWPR